LSTPPLPPSPQRREGGGGGGERKKTGKEDKGNPKIKEKKTRRKEVRKVVMAKRGNT